MNLADLPDDGSGEPEYYNQPQDYPVQYTGHLIAPLFQVRSAVPDAYMEQEDTFSEAMRAYVEDKDPYMGPAQFRAYIDEFGKSIFSGEPNFRTEVVVQSTAVDEEWGKDIEDVELGFTYLVAIYETGTHETHGEEEYRILEGRHPSTIEKMKQQLEECLEGVPYGIGQTTLVPHKKNEKPIKKEHGRYE